MSMANDDCPPNQLQAVIREILSTNSAHPYSFISMVQRFINQYNLTHTTEPHEIIHIAYERTRKAEKKQTIINYKAWLRSTCLNIIREKSRERRKETLMDPQSHEFEAQTAVEVNSEPVSQVTQEQRIDLLFLALERLFEIRPDIGQLLKFRLLDGYDWVQIQKILAEEGEDCKLATLRKRAERGKRLLRRIYHQLEKDLLQEQGVQG
ncbi:MAG: hypothetical protein ACFB5Z_02085 [Elainellaceae cyanobacterium]